MVANGASFTYTFNPANNSLLQTGGAPLKGIGEATWVKLPNDNILIIDSGNGNSGSTSAEQYNPASDTWASAGTAPNIWPDVSGSGFVSEMGPAFLLPNGNAIFFGGNGVTAIYNNGTWSQGTSIPNGLGMKDAAGVMMNNGQILLAVCSQGNNSAGTNINGAPPSSFYTFDYTANGGSGDYTQVPAPGMAVTLDRIANAFEFLNLPDGSILVCGFGGQCYVYSPTGSAINAGKPNVTGVSVNGDGSLHISGTLLNGISQGSSFGDNAENDSNYPLVRFTDASGNVRYGRTYNWSSTSVMTGTNILTTECTVPSGASAADSIQVIANGNASDPVALNYAVNGITWVDFNFGGTEDGSFNNPWNSLSQGNFHATSGGLIVIKAGSSAETLSLTKPMRIVSYGGTAHIGP